MGDITINRNRGSKASAIANRNVKSNPVTAQAISAIADYVRRYPNGVTSEEITEHLRAVLPQPHNWRPNDVSPRIANCKEQKRIMSVGIRNSRQILVKYEEQMSLLEVA